MAQSTSPLLRLFLALRRWVLRICKPQCVERALIGLLRRLSLLGHLLHLKLHPFRKRNDSDKPPKDELTFTKDDEHKPYTIIRHGDTISLDEASFSLYPFSANGIRNTSRSSVRLGNPQSRSSSQRPDSDYSHSNAGSVFDLQLYPTRPPSRIVPSRNPRRQQSTSMPDLHSPYEPSRSGYPILHTPRQGRYPQPRSPTPEIEVTSPVSPGNQTSPVNLEPYHSGRYPRIPNVSNQPDNSSPCPSPPPGIDVEPISPIMEVTSPRNFSETSFQVPSSSAHSISHSHLSDTTRTSLDVTADVIPLGATSTRDTSDHNLDEDHNIQPVLPEATKRYIRRTKTRKQYKNLIIDPLTTTFEKPAAPAGWIRMAHPEGACYYHHPAKRVYTDSDLSDPEILNRTMDHITRLERLVETYQQNFPPNAVLMIDVNHVKGGGLETTYYYADHDERTIFFLHPLEAYDIDASYEIEGIRSHRHLGYELQSQYWFFVSLYPDCLVLTVAMVGELRDIVLYLIGDTMTSPFSTAPYTLEDLLKILSITGEMENNAKPGYPGCMGLFARHMFIFYHTRFLNFHGESFARIERDFSVFGDTLNKRTWLVKMLSFILFSAPDVHLRNLQKMWVDGIMHQSVWKQSMQKLNDEWQEFVFFATVMLTSNVGFLAIQSVDTDNDPFRSSAQILSYLSVVANIGTLILGLLLMRQNRTKNRETADDVQSFLTRRNHPRLGLETLAILYSLPYALLMWGVVAFLGAFCCVFFQNSNIQTRSLVGSLSLVLAVLIVWCIITSWETKEDTDEPDRPLTYEEQQEPDEDPNSECPPKNSIFAKILDNLPALMYMGRRNSVDSEETAVC